jgi:hypothetical protein
MTNNNWRYIVTKKIFEKIDVNRILKIAVYILLFFLVFGNLVSISYGVESLNLIRVFSDDETLAVYNVLTNAKYNDINPRGIYQYGYFYHTTGFLIIKALEYFGFKVDAMLVALVLRLISLISYALAGLLTYKIFTLSFKGAKVFGLILVLLFLSIPGFAYWSRFVHPDTLQVLLILLAALVAFSKHKAVNVLLASVFAGMAFGTKYSGIFILPFLFLPYFLYSMNHSPKNKKFWLKMISIFILAILVFLIMWIVTNPYAIQNLDELQRDYSWVQKYVTRGHAKAESTNPFLWFTLLWKQFGWLNGMVVIAGITMLLISLLVMVKKDGLKKFIGDHTHRNVLTSILYITGSLIYLMLIINMRRPRYMFHFLPFIPIIAMYGCQKISDLFKSNLMKQFIVVILFFSVSFLTLDTLAEPSTATLKHDHEYIKAGKFLAQNANWNSKILADPYSYVPPEFKLVIFEWDIDESKIKKFRPDIIILNAKVARVKAWKKKGTLFKDLNFYKGSFDKSENYFQFLKKIFSPDSRWKIIYETENMVILKKLRGAKKILP